MPRKKTYPYPNYKNPVRLSPLVKEAREQLKELAQKIMANEKIFQRKKEWENSGFAFLNWSIK